MATMTKKQFCESVYAMYKLLGGDGCAQCSDERVSCGYKKENTVLTNAIIHACNVHNVPFTMDCDKHCINIVVDFNK